MDNTKRDAVIKDEDKVVTVEAKVTSSDLNDPFYSAKVRVDAIKARSYISSLKG
jgi:hypothetical protein